MYVSQGPLLGFGGAARVSPSRAINREAILTGNFGSEVLRSIGPGVRLTIAALAAPVSASQALSRSIKSCA
jgi:hypothetical protein